MPAPLPPFAAAAGSPSPSLVFVGEAWGATEDDCGGIPFSGAAGQELFRLLAEATGHQPALAQEVISAMRDRDGLAWLAPRQEWLSSAGIALTNVLALRPPDNKLERLCSPKSALPHGYSLPAITRAFYLSPGLLPEVARLYGELAAWNPRLIVALGATASWALLQAMGIGGIRGSIAQARPFLPAEIRPEAQDSETLQTAYDVLALAKMKVLPTYHPAAIFRSWQWRPILQADLIKAWREKDFPEIRRPTREILVRPTIEEVEAWTRATRAGWGTLYHMISPDVETASGQITCFGFARSPREAMVVPFWKTLRGGNWWPDTGTEARAWTCCEELLALGPRVGQNFIYDIQYCRKSPLNMERFAPGGEDTMLLHHGLFPEMQKGLGFLGSIYTNEQSWKLMRRKKADTEKRDE